MRFEAGDVSDQALVATLVHELVICKEYFDRFVYFAGQNISGDQSKAVKIKSYSCYAGFLHHLYEFYIGCIKRELLDLSSPKSAEADRMINAEVENALRRKRHVIENGFAPEWENHISVYQIEVPSEFASEFRKIRNRTAHADLRRASPTNQMPLGEFYKRYHRLVYVLYEQSHWLWTAKDIEAFDWGAIEDFDLAVRC